MHNPEMLVDLSQEELESIVKDGVKEILRKVIGGVRSIRKKTWFVAVKAAVIEYQRILKEDFLPVLVKDFGTKMVVKFSGGKLIEEDKDKLKVFLEMVRKSDVNAA